MEKKTMNVLQELWYFILWYFISGDWVVDARKREEERKQQMIANIPMPLCEDKVQHLENMACFDYCTQCITTAYWERRHEEQEKLADMIAARIRQLHK